MRHRFFFILLLLSLLLSACGPTQAEVDATALQIAQNHFSTQTAQAPTVTSTLTPSPSATATPTPSPTLAHTPTITLTPTPRWMGAALTLKDLPDGFEQSDPEEMSMLQQDLPDNAVVFSFEHEVKAQAVLGYLIPLSSSLDRLAFDRMMPVSLEILADDLGTTSSPAAFPGIEDVGEVRSASMFVSKIGSLSLHSDGLLFRRGDVGVFLFVFYPDGDEPAVQIADLARLLDKRLGALLKPSDTWRDEFDTAPVEPWEWVNENPESWSLTDGYLRINASSFPTGQENLLLRPVTSPDFIVQTAVRFTPQANFQFAGLVIYQDAYSFLQLGRAFCDTPGDCVGSGIYFDQVLVSRKSGENFGIRALSQGKVFLRLELRGAQVKAFYSFEGNTWFAMGTHELPSGFQVNGVGLTASQDYYTPDAELPADFDYFELVEGK